MENEKNESIEPTAEKAGIAEAQEATVPGAVPSPGEPSREALSAACEKLAQEKAELHDRLLRKAAEMENLRKRMQREKEDHIQHANLELVRTLLPVLDSFERALQHRDSNGSEQFFEGMQLIYRELEGALKRAGLTALETHGKLFDPHVHEAVETVEAPGYRDQEIVEELQRGYKFKQRLLRPAIVRVAVAREASPAEPDDSPKGGR